MQNINGRHWSFGLEKREKKQGTSPTKIKKSKNKSRGQNQKWTFLKMSKNENPKIVLKKALQNHSETIQVTFLFRQWIDVLPSEKSAFLVCFGCVANEG
jgi:hypothetical protein